MRLYLKARILPAFGGMAAFAVAACMWLGAGAAVAGPKQVAKGRFLAMPRIGLAWT